MPEDCRDHLPWLQRAIVIIALAFTVGPVRAASFDDTLSTWAKTLTDRAAALESSMAEPMARVGGGPTMRMGKAVGTRVWLLTHRLMELGYLGEESLTDTFDEKVDAAVRAFQRDNNLTDDGLVGLGTTSALDRTPVQTVAILRRTAAEMEALRAEGRRDQLLVNLPSQTVTLARHGEYMLTMRAIVGRPSRETPLLRDKVTHVIVNPTWTVPPTVMKKDKLPNLRKTGQPGIKHADIYLDDTLVPDPTQVDWSEVTPGRLRIVQTPGDHNALGRFRFNLTNALSIYLHGTNEPRLFARDIRTISSGCVRLEDARLMAEILLAPNGVDAARIDRLLATGTPQWVKLAEPMPVRFTYWMATVGEDGRVRVHPDIYGLAADEVAAIPAPTSATLPASIPTVGAN